MTNTDCYVRATELIGFEELVESGDISAANLLIKAGIFPEKLNEPDALISARAFAHLQEIAADELKRPNFGLEWALKTPDHFPNLGPLILLAKTATNLQEFLNSGLQYWKFHTNDYALKQLHDEATGLCIIRCVPASVAPPTRQRAEHAVANMVAVSRMVINRKDVNPSVVRFRHGRPHDIAVHQRVFQCPIEFDAPFTEILFDPKLLAHSTDGSLAVLKPIIGLYIRHRLQRLQNYDQTMTKTIAMAIPSVLGTGLCNIEFIAAAIGISAKKLRRLLAAEGTTFSNILEEVRSGLARKYLTETNAPVGNIAGLLDYSATSSFILAFRRWTGISPVAFRKTTRSAI